MEVPMLRKRSKALSTIIIIGALFMVNTLLSMDLTYTVVNLEDISRYDEDRIMYQHIEITPVQYFPNVTDNSIAALLIIKDKKMYLFMDGFDNPSEVKTKKVILETENRLIPDIWANKIDNLPDYMKITDRRVEIQRKMADQGEKSSSKSLGGKFDSLYKNAKNKLITQHVKTFKILMINRKESGLYVVRKPIPKRIYDNGPTKFFTSVSGKTIDEKQYYAEDADGDGITETFAVQIGDGFSWGYKSGPNIIFIYKNTQKEISDIIGKLAHEAYYGTEEEDKNIQKTIFQEDEINRMIDDIYRLTPEDEKLLMVK